MTTNSTINGSRITGNFSGITTPISTITLASDIAEATVITKAAILLIDAVSTVLRA